MLKKTVFMLAMTMALAACDDSDCKKETEKLKAEIETIKKELAGLRKASPGKTDDAAKEKTDDAEKPAGSIDVAVLKVKGGLMGAHKQTEVAVRLTNNSTIFLSQAFVDAQGYDKSDEFLGECKCILNNVQPKKSRVGTCTILDVPLREVHRVEAVFDGPLTSDEKRQVKCEKGHWRRK